MSPEAALAALRAAVGEPDPRTRGADLRWQVRGPFGGAALELRDREGVPMLMIHRERDCISEICDVMFVELRSADDIDLIARKLGVYQQSPGRF